MINRGPLRYVWSLMVLILLTGAGLLHAQDGSDPVAGEIQLDEKAVLILWSQKSDESLASEADQFSDYLVRSLRTALTKETYRIVDSAMLPSWPNNPLDWAVKAGTDKSVRWIFLAEIEVRAQSLSWKIEAYDGRRRSLRASDVFSTFPGLSALPYLDDSSRSVVLAWLGSIAADREIVNLTKHSQKVYGSQEGVQVWYGSHDTGILAGTIQKGALEALYFPFPMGEPLLLEVNMEGYWPRSLVLPEGVTDNPVKLPVLQKKSNWAWGLGTGTGRLLGLTYLYRWYPVPDRFFLRFDNAFWAGYSFTPGAVPLWHDELRFGLGLYLQNKVDGTLRFAAGSGGSGVVSFLPASEGGNFRSALDILLDPVWFSLEYHFPRWAVCFEFRLPYATGSGLLNQDWLEPSGGGPFVSLGVLIK